MLEILWYYWDYEIHVILTEILWYCWDYEIMWYYWDYEIHVILTEILWYCWDYEILWYYWDYEIHVILTEILWYCWDYEILWYYWNFWDLHDAYWDPMIPLRYYDTKVFRILTFTVFVRLILLQYVTTIFTDSKPSIH